MSQRANTEFKIVKTFQKSCHSGFQPRYDILNPSRYLCHPLHRQIFNPHSKNTLFKNDSFYSHLYQESLTVLNWYQGPGPGL